jgi:hypothetical protein
MLDSRTFITAIAPLARIVPGNSSAAGTAPRVMRPATRTMTAPSRTRSSPRRLERAAAKPGRGGEVEAGLELGEDRREAGDRAAQVIAEGDHADYEESPLQPDVTLAGSGRRRLCSTHE